MLEIAYQFVRRVRRTSLALRVRVDMAWLLLRNRFGWSAVATGRAGVVVSLTTYGKRVDSVHLAIESIARGRTAPSRLILWVDDATLFVNLPRPLLRLRGRGLEVKLCENYGPHKKYYPYVESQEAFTSPLVTADDDVIYPSSWLHGLLTAHKDFPNCVSCYRARVVLLRDGKFVPYREWPMCKSTHPSYRTIATGVCGVIYPSVLLQELKRAGTDFQVRCPKADDLWLHLQAIRSSFQIRQIQPEVIHFPMIPGTQDTALLLDNYAQGDGNDKQLALTYEATDLWLLEHNSVASSAA
jgi:hypothetical protein